MNVEELVQECGDYTDDTGVVVVVDVGGGEDKTFLVTGTEDREDGNLTIIAEEI